MATRNKTDKPAGPKTATTKKAATPARKARATGTPRAKRVAAPAVAPEPTPGKKAEGLLRAGLKALGNVRDDVVKRQTHVIESLLGVKVNDAAAGFGFKKFEDVFDQRVATALERLGLMAGAQEIAALRDEVRQLREELAALQGMKAPARRSASR
jgi:hypothetical protein